MSESEINLRLVELRRAQNWTQEQFAERIGISKSAVYRMEKGEHSPGAEILAKIVRATGVSADWLLFGSHSGPGAQLALASELVQSERELNTRLKQAEARAEQAEARARELATKAEVRMVALEAENRELKREAALGRAEELNMARGLGLEHVALMALRGTQELTWKVLVSMHEAERPVTFEHLASAVHADSTQKLKELKAELMILEREGIVVGEREGERDERLYQLRNTTTLVRARASGDLGQAAGEFLRSFVRDVVPAAMESKGYFTRIVAKIPKMKVQEVTRQVRATVFEVLEQAERSGEEEVEENVCVLLGIHVP